MTLNPEFVRNVRLQRKAAFVGGMVLFFLLIISGVLMWYGVGMNAPCLNSDQRWREFCQLGFDLLLVLEVVLLFGLPGFAVGSSFISEQVRGTLIFQQMTTLSPHEMVLGKLFGNSIVWYVLAALLLPLAFVCGMIGGLDFFTVFKIYTLLYVGSLVCLTIAGLASLVCISAETSPGGEANQKGNLQGWKPAIGGLGSVLFLAPLMVGYLPDLLRLKVTFYGVSRSSFTAALGILIFLGGWAYVGAVRKYKKLQLIPLSPMPTWLFFASLEILLVGLLWGGRPHNTSDLQSLRSIHWFPIPKFQTFCDDIILFLVYYLGINWLALLWPLCASLMTRNQLCQWRSTEKDAFSILKRTEIRNAMRTLLVAVGFSLTGLCALWWSFSVHLDKYDFYHAHISNTFEIFVVTTLAFLATLAAMAGFLQFCTMHFSRSAAGKGLILFFIMMGVAAGAFLNNENFPGLINPLVLTAVAMSSVKDLAIAWKGLLIEILLVVFWVGLAYLEWWWTHRKMQSQEENQSAAA